MGRSDEKVLWELSGRYTSIAIEGENGYINKHADLSKENSLISNCSSEEGQTNRRKRRYDTFSLVLSLAVCTAGCWVMWGTNLYDNLVQQNLILTNSSMRFETWKDRPVDALLKVFVFNYTNVEEFVSGDTTKLKVEEIGPYTYIEKLERVNIIFHDNGTMSYQDKKTYIFSPEHSKGTEMDLVTVPNIPFWGTVSFGKESSFFTQMSLSYVLNTMQATPFLELEVGEYLWGYEDRFSALVSNVMGLQHSLPFTTFGVLAGANGTQKDIVTVHTGERDLSKIGIVSSYNAEDSLDFWNSDECNRIDGSDGTLYPPSVINADSKLYIYTKAMCRRMPLEYHSRYFDKHNIPIMRFNVPRDIFASGKVASNNLCYCNENNADECLPSGVFNASPCAFGGPVVTSLPHFLYGDDVLFEHIEGLEPSEEIHGSFVEVDPVLGLPVGGKSRLQINLMARKSATVSRATSNFMDKLIMPVAWLDFGVEKLPEDLSGLIRITTFGVQAAKTILSYSFIISVIVIAALIIKSILAKARERRMVEQLNKSTTAVPLVMSLGKAI